MELELQSFKGETNVFHWVRKVDMLGKVRNMSDAETFCYACACLDGPAAVWLDTVTVSTWTELKHLVCERFCMDREALLASFTALRQGSKLIGHYTDVFHSLVAQLQRLGQHLPEVLRLQRYLAGIRPELRQRVIASHPTSIEAAYDLAIYLEQPLSGTATLHSHLLADQGLQEPAEQLVLNGSFAEITDLKGDDICSLSLRIQRLKDQVACTGVWGDMQQHLFEELEAEVAVLSGRYASLEPEIQKACVPRRVYADAQRLPSNAESEFDDGHSVASTYGDCYSDEDFGASDTMRGCAGSQANDSDLADEVAEFVDCIPVDHGRDFCLIADCHDSHGDDSGSESDGHASDSDNIQGASCSMQVVTQLVDCEPERSIVCSVNQEEHVEQLQLFNIGNQALGIAEEEQQAEVQLRASDHTTKLEPSAAQEHLVDQQRCAVLKLANMNSEVPLAEAAQCISGRLICNAQVEAVDSNCGKSAACKDALFRDCVVGDCKDANLSGMLVKDAMHGWFLPWETKFFVDPGGLMVAASRDAWIFGDTVSSLLQAWDTFVTRHAHRLLLFDTPDAMWWLAVVIKLLILAALVKDHKHHPRYKCLT